MSSPVWQKRNYNKQTRLRHRRIARAYGVTWPPIVGQIVCDCRFKHLPVTWIDVRWDDVKVSDEFCCSIDHCLTPVPHDGYDHEKVIG